MISAPLILAELKQKGFRQTAIRVAVVTYFVKHTKPSAAADILAVIKKKIPSVDKTTIYRELAFLKEQKIIQEIQLGEDKKRFELLSDEHHHHIVCVKCDAIEDVALEKDLSHEEKRISTLKNFLILNHSLEFFGLCANCQ